MHEIVRSNNPVLLNFVEVLLKDAGLSPLLVDVHTSAVEGSIGVLPRRILIEESELSRARQVLREADLEHEISTRGSG